MQGSRDRLARQRYARSARCPRHCNEARGATSCINCCVRGRPGDDAWCCSACLCSSPARESWYPPPSPVCLRRGQLVLSCVLNFNYSPRSVSTTTSPMEWKPRIERGGSRSMAPPVLGCLPGTWRRGGASGGRAACTCRAPRAAVARGARGGRGERDRDASLRAAQARGGA